MKRFTVKVNVLLLASLLGVSAAEVGVAMASPTPVAKCGIAKVKAAAKKVQAKLNCYLRSVRRNVPVDSECLQRAEDRFEAVIAKAEAKGGCAQTGQAAAIEDAVDNCVASIRNPFLCRPDFMSCLSGSECCSGFCGGGLICQTP